MAKILTPAITKMDGSISAALKRKRRARTKES